jgi:membrane-associated protease RseP (regulator of RpoE activity)
LYPLALFTTIRYSIEGFSLNQIFFDALVKQRNMKVLLTTCFPVVGGILGMHLLQEVVHYLVAKWRRIKIGPPVPIPSLAVGLFGCITPIRSFPSNRAALLDFALSGPFATTVASVGCIIASVLLTVRASPAALANFPVLPTMIFKSSFLAGTLTSWIASKAMMLPLAQPIPVHPLFLVGYSGLIASGLNLLPIFRLDGGRACSAAMGSRQGAVISVSVLLFLLSLALSGGSGIGFSWGMIVAIFQRQQEIPARDDVTEVDNVRLGAWLFSFLLAIGILTPFPGAPSIL